MKLRNKYILFVGLIHLILVLLVIELMHKNLYVFIAGEVLVVISIVASFSVYKSLIEPLNLISAGTEAIKDKEFNTRFVKVGQPEMDQLVEVYNQMIDQLREERIQQNEKHYFLERLIQASPSGIILLDFEGRIESVNPAAENLLGLPASQISGKPLESLPGNLIRGLTQLQEGSPEIIYLNGIRAFKCQKSHFLDRGFRHYFILMEELTEEIFKTEKKAYEKVVRMMSHEINNSIGAINSILNSVLNYKQQLQAEDQEDYSYALQVAIDRNVSLSRFMSNFAEVVRIPPPQKTDFDLHSLLQAVHILMDATCRKQSIEWKWELSGEQLYVRADRQQIEHVLVNIIKNAIEAIGKNGSITLFTNNHPAQLIVRDTGKGISQEASKHLFSPFYSTKKDGQGIGLTLIREILLLHGFPFSLQTKENGLTEFSIEFAEVKKPVTIA